MATSLLYLTMESQKELHSSQTDSKPIKRRCVNLDWLEVHAHEPLVEIRDAAYYRRCGYIVHERDYGTRVYRQMFTIEGTDGENLLEIRRDPASQGLHGIHEMNECHIRLTNRTCYFEDAAASFERFLEAHGYTDIRISRVDICLDFVKFDKGDDPQAFVRRYFRHKYAKINQGRISSHGDDAWAGQEWNSLSWGSKTSVVTTKLYNKTLELHDVKSDSFAKPYIRQAWAICGLVDDWLRVTKDGELVNVWRVEFSMRSAVKGWVPIEIDGEPKNYQSLRNTLDCYAGRDRLLVMFASLANHYFRFKKYKQGKRKDRCPDKILFDFSGAQITYKLSVTDPIAGSGTKLKDRWQALLTKLRLYQQSHSIPEIYKACEVLISAITEDGIRSDLANPWSYEELQTMRLLMNVRTRDKSLEYEAAMTEVKRLLKITDRTISIF